MKNLASYIPKIFRAHPLLAVLAVAFLAASPVAAQVNYFWDANGNGSDSTYGGNGTWDTTTANWNTSPTIGSGTLVNWTGAADNARFLRGTSGDVTVAAGGVSARIVSVGRSEGSFTTGSANYTFSGAPITISLGGFATVLTASFGSTAVFNNAIALSSANVKLEINGAGASSLTFGGGLSNAAAAVSELKFTGFTGTGTFDVTGAITKNGANNFKLVVGDVNSTPAATVVKLSANNTGIGGSASENVVNQGTLYLNHNSALGAAGGLTVANAQSGLSDTTSVLIGVSGVTNSKSITFATTSDTGDSRTVGSDITSGTAVFSGGFTLGQFAASGTGSSLRITAAAGGNTILSNVINDGANTSGFTKVGAGTVTLAGGSANTYDGATIVSAGTLNLNKTAGVNAISGSSVTVTNSGSVLLISTSNQVADGATVTLSGGTIRRGGDVSEVFGNLNLAAASFLDYGSGAAGALTFGTYTPTHLLTVQNFSEGSTLKFGNDIGGSLPTGGALTNSLFSFSNAFTYDSGTFTITSVPEPSTLLAALGLSGLLLWSVRRKTARRVD